MTVPYIICSDHFSTAGISDLTMYFALLSLFFIFYFFRPVENYSIKLRHKKKERKKEHE